MNSCRFAFWAMFSFLVAADAHAQSFGIELLNNVMPASGGMAGTSIASPQDLQSSINGNPATLTQFRGAQFGFAGAWIDPTYSLSVEQPGLPAIGVGPFTSAQSDAHGLAAANISVCDVLPGVDLDFFAGGMFKETQTFGITTAGVQSYWVGSGLTWRFGRGSCANCGVY